PVFAIRTEDDLGIGDTEGVRQMIDWCHRHNLSIFQTLPINEVSDDNSPYNALSSQAIEPPTIAISPRHIPDLSQDQFRRIATAEGLAKLHQGPVNYPEVKALKWKLLEAAFDSFWRDHLQSRGNGRSGKRPPHPGPLRLRGGEGESSPVPGYPPLPGRAGE